MCPAYVTLCVHVSGIHACSSGCVHMCICMRRPEVNIWCSQPLLHLAFWDRVLHQLARLADQWASAILLSLPPSIGITGPCLAFYWGSGDLNSGSHPAQQAPYQLSYQSSLRLSLFLSSYVPPNMTFFWSLLFGTTGDPCSVFLWQCKMACPSLPFEI